MIVTFQGYNGKKNGVVSTITAVAAMAAMTKSAKTLVLQLIDKDIDTVEEIRLKRLYCDDGRVGSYKAGRGKWRKQIQSNK